MKVPLKYLDISRSRLEMCAGHGVWKVIEAVGELSKTDKAYITTRGRGVLKDSYRSLQILKDS